MNPGLASWAKAPANNGIRNHSRPPQSTPSFLQRTQAAQAAWEVRGNFQPGIAAKEWYKSVLASSLFCRRVSSLRSQPEPDGLPRERSAMPNEHQDNRDPP